MAFNFALSNGSVYCVLSHARYVTDGHTEKRREFAAPEKISQNITAVFLNVANLILCPMQKTRSIYRNKVSSYFQTSKISFQLREMSRK